MQIYKEYKYGGGGNLNIFLLLMLLFYVNEALAWRYSVVRGEAS